jgi:hypothetical protein
MAQTIAALNAAQNPAMRYHPRTGTRTRLLSLVIESQPEREGVVPLPRTPPTARPALRSVEQFENRGTLPSDDR